MFTKDSDVSVATSTLFKITIFVLALWFAWTVRDILVLLLISVTLASALDPMVDLLQRYHVPRALSVLTVYILAIGLVVLIGYAVSPAVVYQFNQLKDSQFLSAEFQNRATNATWLQTFNLTDLITRNVQSLGAQLGNYTGDFFRTTLGVFGGFVEVIAVLVISFYLLAEKNGMKHFVYSFVPKDRQPEILKVVHKMQKRVGGWLIGQILASFIIFGITLIVMTLLGVKFALVLAILTGFFELVPYLGPIISAIPAIFFAFIQSPTLAVIVLLYYVLLSKFEGYILVPKIMQRTIGASPMIILIAILVGFKLDGILGVLLAVPVVAMIHVVVEEWETLKGATTINE